MDPVSICVQVASSLNSIFYFHQTCKDTLLEGGNSRLDFGDRDYIFKVT